VALLKAKLIAERSGTYTSYVFKDLETSTFIMCTKLPNWKSPAIAIGDEGFLHYKTVVAGEEYYDPQLDENKKYLYSNIYFIDFILDNKTTHKNELIL
jgi:hypothetical protein